MATRRIFLKQAVGMAAASAGVSVTDGGSLEASQRQTANSPPAAAVAGPAVQRGPIGYIRQDIPKFEMPVYRGERYDAMVPDTLDLQERAALAVNMLTRGPLPDHRDELNHTVRPATGGEPPAATAFDGTMRLLAAPRLPSGQ